MLVALARLEETPLSTWLRESGPAFFTTLTLHSLAMGLVVGVNIALALRLLGVTPGFSLTVFRPFFRLHWLGVLVISASGIALLLAYPAKALTNPLFYGKLLALSLALTLFRSIEAGSRTKEPSRRQAAILLGLWVLVIFAGRFLAYTNSILLASSFY